MNHVASLFERLGGQAAVDAAVDIFYQRVLADPSVNHFFTNTNMDSQRRKQQAFMTMAFGGPSRYAGKDMRAAHAHLDLTDAHFDMTREQAQAAALAAVASLRSPSTRCRPSGGATATPSISPARHATASAHRASVPIRPVGPCCSVEPMGRMMEREMPR